MKYGKVDALAHQLSIIEAEESIEAYRLCGLDPLNVDHGTVEHNIEAGGGIAIVVAEFGLFMPPLNQHYFAIHRQLYAGNAVLYKFDASGATIDFDKPELVEVRWLASGYEVERAIKNDEVDRPQMHLNGRLVWEWPAPKPPLDRFAEEIAQGWKK